MKFGGEFRFAHSFSWSPQNIIPTVFGGRRCSRGVLTELRVCFRTAERSQRIYCGLPIVGHQREV